MQHSHAHQCIESLYWSPPKWFQCKWRETKSTVWEEEEKKASWSLSRAWRSANCSASKRCPNKHRDTVMEAPLDLLKPCCHLSLTKKKIKKHFFCTEWGQISFSLSLQCWEFALPLHQERISWWPVWTRRTITATKRPFKSPHESAASRQTWKNVTLSFKIEEATWAWSEKHVHCMCCGISWS